MLSVQVPDGTTLHSVVESGAGTAVVANISPLTELIAASIAGGFDYNDGDTMRVVAFKAADGHMSFVLFDDHGFFIATKQRAAALPAMGARTSFWDMGINASGVATMSALSTLEVTAVDAVANTYTRQRMSDGRVETWEKQQAARRRPPPPARHERARDRHAASAGHGIGVSATVNPNLSFLSVTVEQPPAP